MDAEAVRDLVERAAESVAPAWPVHSFVTANPLAGFTDRPFPAAVRAGERLFGGRGYPAVDVFRRAFDDGRIDRTELTRLLTEAGENVTPAASLDRLADARTEPARTGGTATARAEAVATKWLAAFFDQGRADWAMPDRERGLYDAFRAVARHDDEIPDPSAVERLPADPAEAVCRLLADRPTDEWERTVERQLAALPGWTGFLTRHAASDGEWASATPATVTGYLAVRLFLLDRFDAPIAPPSDDDRTAEARELAECWLTAWERTYRRGLVDAIADRGRASEPSENRPDAQLVFCIDTRSEVIRRHVERTGDYETHGYAGFFGVPMRYDGYDTAGAVDACPPIVDPEHRIGDRVSGDGDGCDRYDQLARVRHAGRELIHTLAGNPGTAFSFVESAGTGYGVGLAARTLLPGRIADAVDALAAHVPATHEFTEPALDGPTGDHDETAGDGRLVGGLSHDQRVAYAATAFELMGIEEFARVVAFVGHASRTTNNPFASSLDCGACAGNPGGPNARVLAAICNDPAVRRSLRDRGIAVPEDTVFVAGEHDTTTDEVTLYDDSVPETHEADLARLRADLSDARAGAAAERAERLPGGSDDAAETRRRAADWAETRPEWGLAGNAAFVIGPRSVTAGLDLDGRVFLHSYKPATDPNGEALAAILAGPAVVTQWINSHYYFATTDETVYGSGSKVTQNPVGNVGVYQGNGGDLQTGLPRESVAAGDGEPYHQPLRLSVVVVAPVERVASAIDDAGRIAELAGNGWLSVTVVDPDREYRAVAFDEGFDAGDATGRSVDTTASAGHDER